MIYLTIGILAALFLVYFAWKWYKAPERSGSEGNDLFSTTAAYGGGSGGGF